MTSNKPTVTEAELATPGAQPVPAPRRSQRAALMLVLVTLLWGLSFPLVKQWQNAAGDCPGGEVVAGASLIAVRMLLALPLLALARPFRLRETTASEHTAGAILGLVFFAGFIFQVVGLAWTTPALSAFLTCVGCAWVPLIAWACWRTAVPRITALGIAVGLVGVAVLSEIDAGWNGVMGWGDVLTLISSVFFAVQIVVLDRFGRRLRAANLTVAFIGTTGLAALALAVLVSACGAGLRAWSAWLVRMLEDPELLRGILIMTLFSTVLAFQWMNTYQPLLSPSRASLVYLLEPVFAAFFSVLGGFEKPSRRLLIGGLIILGGNLLVELPGLLRSRANAD